MFVFQGKSDRLPVYVDLVGYGHHGRLLNRAFEFLDLDVHAVLSVGGPVTYFLIIGSRFLVALATFT